MRTTFITCLIVIFSFSCFAQSQVIKEINYAFDKVGVIAANTTRKNVFVYGSDKNKVQVYDLRKDSAQTAFDTIMKYTIVYDSSKSQVTQTAFVKKTGGGWKKEAEVITVYNKNKTVSEIQWKTIKKDKMVPYAKFTYSSDSLKRPREIEYSVADTTGKFKPDTKLNYEYGRKGLKASYLTNMQDGKWVRLSMYSVNFDSSNVIVALMKFKTGNRLDNRYSIENSWSEEKQLRTLTFKDYHPETAEFAGKPQASSYIAAYYSDSLITGVTGYLKNPKGSNWVKAVGVKYVYGSAGHPLNSVLKNYLKYDALKVRFDDFVSEDNISDVAGTVSNSKFYGRDQTNKGLLFSMDGVMMKYLAP